MQHGDIHGHMHLRQRAYRGNTVKHPYPSSNHYIKRLDLVMYVVGIIGPLVSIPQLLEIYVRHNAQGISIFTWTGYVAITSLWLLYGLAHREKPIIITQCLWLLVNSAVVIGAILY